MPELNVLHAVLTTLILAATIWSFVKEKIPPDLTAGLALLALLLSGVLTPEEAFAGFSHPATMAVAAVLVLSAGIERSGVLSFVARRVLQPLGRHEWLLTAVLMVLIAGLSAFINNTAAVAVFIPLVLEVCRRTGASPGRVLMPMAHAAALGGMTTLIGTSTNLVVHEYARSQGLEGFAMFELGRVGLPMLLAAFAYILLVGRWFLPRTAVMEGSLLGPPEPYTVELRIPPGSAWIGKEVRPERLERDLDLTLIEIVRGEESLDLGATPRPRFQLGDSLRVKGVLERVLALAHHGDVALHRPSTYPYPKTSDGRPASAARSLAEVVLLFTSGLIGRTLKAARFAEHYNAIVLGLRRRGTIRDRPATTPLKAGDVLLVEGPPDALRTIAGARGFLAIGTPVLPEERPARVAIAILTLVGVVSVAALGLLPVVTAAAAGCAVLMLTGGLRPREAYQAVDLSLIVVLGGSFALGAAVDKSGLTQLLAGGLAGLTERTGAYLALAAFFLVAVLMSEFMSNTGTAALLAPLAVSAAEGMGINPTPLLVAVTFGCSAAFAMPIGYQTNLMILGPGGYRVKDFLRLGIPLDLVLAAVALFLIPRFWPLVGP
ncbi:MAG: SLC13 family permease [Gemmatimonadales bacterium]